MKVKICGITHPRDARLAEQAGADAVGMIFAPVSKRCVTLEQARAISHALGALTAKVGVFVDAELDTMLRYAELLRLNAIQLHGQENADIINALRDALAPSVALIKVLKVAANAVPSLETLDDKTIDLFLLDGLVGGSGEVFDWQSVQHLRGHKKLLLAGGLNPNNVQQAIAALQPYGVDVASGVEARAGVKDAAKVGEFVARAKQASS